MGRVRDSWQSGFCLSVAKLESARSDIITLVQKDHHFCSELAVLSDHDKLTDLAHFSGNTKSPRLRKLCPILIQGILRVGGRLDRLTLPADRKHSIILPSSHHVAGLIISHIHCKECHTGPLHTLAVVSSSSSTFICQ